MKPILRILSITLLFPAWLGYAQPTPPSAGPRVQALVAAMGNQLHVVHEVQSVGSNLSPFKRDTITVPDNLLNKLVLASLDRELARDDPSARRIYFALSPPPRRRGALQGEALLDWVTTQLEPMPERRSWDTIVVALPGYRAMARERLPSRLGGMGIFAQPLCQSDPESCERGWTPPSGAEAVTPEGEPIQANHFVAPYSLVEVVVLDAKTLQVLDRGQSVQHRKMFDPKSDSLDVFRNVGPDALAQQLVTMVERSVEAALAGTEKRGNVDVRERGAVKRD